ncbi:MAG: transcription antitermination factor NusB [Gammaproteobacteria bacterium]
MGGNAPDNMKNRQAKGARGKPSARTLARERALQALYQWDFTEQSVTDIAQQFREDQDMSGVDAEYFELLLSGVARAVESIDESYGPALDRPPETLDAIERAILRIGAFELLHCPEVPYRVVINESVELAKRFGAEQGHKYVNAVLDKTSMEARSIERGAC